jgi:hypothetical protein
VCGDGNALLVGAVGEIELALDHPQPIISIKRIIRVTECIRLQSDKPLDLLHEVFLWWTLGIFTVDSAFDGFNHPPQQLSLVCQHLNYIERWWWWLHHWLTAMNLLDRLRLIFFFGNCIKACQQTS